MSAYASASEMDEASAPPRMRCETKAYKKGSSQTDERFVPRSHRNIVPRRVAVVFGVLGILALAGVEHPLLADQPASGGARPTTSAGPHLYWELPPEHGGANGPGAAALERSIAVDQSFLVTLMDEPTVRDPAHVTAEHIATANPTIPTAGASKAAALYSSEFEQQFGPRTTTENQLANVVRLIEQAASPSSIVGHSRLSDGNSSAAAQECWPASLQSFKSPSCGVQRFGVRTIDFSLRPEAGVGDNRAGGVQLRSATDAALTLETGMWTVLKAPTAEQLLTDEADFDLSEARSRVRGLTRFGLWLTRPQVIRSGDADQGAVSVAEIVREINGTSLFREFWANGELVENPMWGRLRWSEGARSPILEADANPGGRWDEDTPILVFAVALMKGKAPNREWLLVAHAPDGERRSVAVQIPEYSEVLVDVGPEGVYYHVRESSASVKLISTGGDAKNTPESTSPSRSKVDAYQQSPSLAFATVVSWTFDGPTLSPESTVASSAANGLNTRVRGGSLESVVGVAGSAKVFDGAYATAEGWYLGPTSGFGFCTWVNPLRLPAPGRLSVVLGSFTSQNRGWVTGLNDQGQVFLALGNGQKALWLASTTRIQTGEWRHVCAAFDSTSTIGKIFVDGALDATGQFQGIDLASGLPATFGRASWADTYYLAAALDEAIYFPWTIDDSYAQQLFGLHTPPPAETAIPRTPTATWLLDEVGSASGLALGDASGNGNEATIVGVGTSSVSGRVGGARRFHGSSATVPLSPTLQSRTFSVSSWVNPESLPSTNRLAVLFSSFAADNTGWMVGLNHEGRIVLSVGDGARAPWLLSVIPIEIGKWSHVVATYDETQGAAKLYVDGQQVAAGQMANPKVNTSAQPTIGRASWANTYHFYGSLDELSVFQVALSSTEVSTMYESFPPEQAQSQTPIGSSRTPTATWLLDEVGSASGLALGDASGNGNQATIVGVGTSSVNGRVGGGRRFHGSSATVPLSPTLQSRTFSVSSWVNPESLPSTNRLAVLFSSFAADNTGWMVGLSHEGRIVLSVGDGARAPWLVSVTPIEIGKWSHVVATYDETQGAAKLYVDGQQVAAGQMANPKVNTSTQPTIGRASWANTYHFYGSLDEVSVFRVALSSTEVSTMYESFPPEQAQSQTPIGGSRTPTATWLLDEVGSASGLALGDASGNGNQATIVGVGTSSVNGRVGGARHFDGGYASIQLTEALKSRTFTISGWVSPASLPSTGRLSVLYSSFTPQNEGWMVGLNHEGRIVLSVGNGASASWALSRSAIPVGEWSHVTATYDESTEVGTIYVDGTSDGTSRWSNPKANSTAPPTLGRASWANTYFFRGRLDHVSVYAVSLNAAEVLSLYRALPSGPSLQNEIIVRNADELRGIFRDGVTPSTRVKIAPGDYIGPFHSNLSGTALRGTPEQPIEFTALDPHALPFIHLRNSWFGPLKHVSFYNLNFTGRANIDGDADPSGLRNHGVSLKNLWWSLCGWGGFAECLKVTKGDAMVVKDITFFAVQASLEGLEDTDSQDRSMMSPYMLAQVDAAVAARQSLGRNTEIAIDFVAVNNSLIRSVYMRRSGTHASIQIKGGSANNVVEANDLAGWAVAHKRLVNRNINLGGGTCPSCFRNENYRQFEAYNTIVRGNRIECGEACGAIATQIGTVWRNNTHSMLTGQGACESPATEQGNRWAMRLTTEANPAHAHEVRPSQNAIFERNVWIYKKCSSSSEFVNRSVLCEDGIDLTLAAETAWPTRRSSGRTTLFSNRTGRVGFHPKSIRGITTCAFATATQP